jgi:hypothetical protein
MKNLMLLISLVFASSLQAGTIVLTFTDNSDNEREDSTSRDASPILAILKSSAQSGQKTSRRPMFRGNTTIDLRLTALNTSTE